MAEDVLNKTAELMTELTAEQLITENLDIWTSAIEQKSASGRGSSKKFSLYGIKKLRELILELAVRGKLVPQDENDEPASVLLQRIAAEKAQLVKDKKIKKPKALPEISEDEKQFELPKGWEWSQLGFLTNYGVCDKAEPHEASNNDWVLELEDVEKSTSKLLKKVRFNERAFKSSKNRFEVNDVIYGKLRPYLDKVLIADEAGVCTTEMIPVRVYRDVRPDYLRLVMKSPYFIKYANESTHGMNLPRMGTDKARAALFPLAPLEEQHRIVAKVDELMSLCDALEAQTEASLSAHQTLVQTLLDALLLSDSTETDSPEHVEINRPESSSNISNLEPVCNIESFEARWQRLYQHFDCLFTTEASIDALKQTILQLAVMGKLVPQDPNDEPAAKLLERIAAEKAQLVKNKKIKKPKALPEISEDEKPFELAKGWEWARLNDISILKGGFAFKSSQFIDHGLHQVIRMGNIRPNNLRLNEKTVFIQAEQAKLTEDYEILDGDILLTMTGTKGKRDYLYSLCVEESNLAQRKLYLNQRLCIVRSQIVSQRFVNTAIKCESLLDGIYAKSTGTANQANIGMDAIMNWSLPLPPLEEQHRIVAKVDKLMALCDQLKARLSDAQTTQLHLTDAIVEQAV